MWCRRKRSSSSSAKRIDTRTAGQRTFGRVGTAAPSSDEDDDDDDPLPATFFDVVKQLLQFLPPSRIAQSPQLEHLFLGTNSRCDTTSALSSSEEEERDCCWPTWSKKVLHFPEKKTSFYGASAASVVLIKRIRFRVRQRHNPYRSRGARRARTLRASFR